MSDRRFKALGQGFFKGTDGIWKLPGGAAGSSIQLGTVSIFDATGNDQVDIWHNGTDLRFQDISGTSDIRVTGMNFSMEADDQKSFWGAVRDTSMWWDGTNFNVQLTTSSTPLFQWKELGGDVRYALAFSVTDSSNLFHMYKGGGWKIWDTSNVDAIACRHDGTDANFTFATTNHVTFSIDTRINASLSITDYIRFLDTELTIASGVITATGSRHKVDTQSDASTDDLDTINGGQDNQLLILSSASNTRDTTVRDQSVSGGNIHLAGATAFTFTNSRDLLMLMYDSASAQWMELSRANNQ